jgi:hypothetical protein
MARGSLRPFHAPCAMRGTVTWDHDLILTGDDTGAEDSRLVQCRTCTACLVEPTNKSVHARSVSVYAGTMCNARCRGTANDVLLGFHSRCSHRITQATETFCRIRIKACQRRFVCGHECRTRYLCMDEAWMLLGADKQARILVGRQPTAIRSSLLLPDSRLQGSLVAKHRASKDG